MNGRTEKSEQTILLEKILFDLKGKKDHIIADHPFQIQLDVMGRKVIVTAPNVVTTPTQAQTVMWATLQVDGEYY